MNKGIRLATGDIVGILNSDDVYAHQNVLANVSHLFHNSEIDLCYGDLVYVAKEDLTKIVRYWRGGPFDAQRIYNGWMPPHPTFFVRRRVYERYGLFNLDAGIAADYELMLRFLLKYSLLSGYIPDVFVKMRLGGVSNASLSARLANAQSAKLAWKLIGLQPRPWTLPLRAFRKLWQYLWK
jgi:glycosyltransferase